MKKNIKTYNGLTYEGKVQIDIFDGNRKLTSYTHNSGRQPLFEFIANCLLGNFTAAKDLYPSKIACFEQTDQLDANNNPIYNRVSSYVHYDSARYLTTGTDGVSINFHFRIPYTCLINNRKIKKMALFPNMASSEVECAEINLDKDIQIPESGGNFTVIVNWAMTITDVTTNIKEN